MSGADEERDDAVLAAEHVLGLLPPVEEAAFAARLDADAELRGLVARWAEGLAGLADAVPEVEPPRGAEAAILRRLFPEERRGLLARLGLLPAVMAGLAAVIAALVLLGPAFFPGPAEPALAARIEAADGTLVVAAAYDPEAGILTLERVEGAVAAGRAQELWLIAGDAAPASLGVLPDGPAAEVVVPASLRAGLPGGTLAISDEAPGGSATGSPGTVLAVGPVTEL